MNNLVAYKMEMWVFARKKTKKKKKRRKKNEEASRRYKRTHSNTHTHTHKKMVIAHRFSPFILPFFKLKNLHIKQER